MWQYTHGMCVHSLGRSDTITFRLNKDENMVIAFQSTLAQKARNPTSKLTNPHPHPTRTCST